MTLIHAIILSIIEGVTEFLPISSTGHLILAARLMGLVQTEFVKTFEIIIQLGAIAAATVMYWEKIKNRKILTRIFWAFLPTAAIGLALYPFIKGVLFDSPFTIIAALLVGGIILILFEYMYKGKNEATIEDLTLLHACLIGTVQSISFVPGISRAAATIFAGLFIGLSRSQAVEFSFLLAIPTMLAATTLDLVKSNLHFSSNELFLLGIGLLGSFITARIVITWFIQFVQTKTFIPFGVYRIIIALIFLIFVI